MAIQWIKKKSKSFIWQFSGETELSLNAETNFNWFQNYRILLIGLKDRMSQTNRHIIFFICSV